ncbi:MAG TPA: hypothetical protein VEB70_05965 [Noviherbaspirillum sp.]|nr:hypothetical protein [Noviherbaspirillum sp.]
MSALLTTEFSGTIRRPIDTVSRQFGDVHHHSTHHVHPDLTFTILSEQDEVCRFRQEVRLMGLKQADEIVQTRLPDGSIDSEVVAGTNQGMRMLQTFRQEGPEATTVKIRIEVPVSGVKKWFKPLFKAAVDSTLKKAFEEDRVDLEQRGYPRG